MSRVRGGNAEQDRLGALERLGRLREQGVLTDEEFAGEKARLMGQQGFEADDDESQDYVGRDGCKRSDPVKLLNRGITHTLNPQRHLDSVLISVD